MELSKFIILEQNSMKEALIQIEANHHGIILTEDLQGKITGLATDGDIRRYLIEGGSLEDKIVNCVNDNFVWGDVNTSRETLIKQLDHRIKFIPLLDANRRLVDVVSRDQLPIQNEEAVYARARSPVRISFGGGGSDLTHYFSDLNGAVINSAISLYSHATLRRRNDEKVLISSRDINETLLFENIEEAFRSEGNSRLIICILKAIRPEFGFELYLYSDFPMRSGLGGSAAIAAAVLGCFNQFRQDHWNAYEIAELAYQAERLHLGIAGGWQDQYATVFGGFNFMEFRMDQNLVHPLRVPSETLLELEESLILCDTTIKHNSGEIHEDQRMQLQKDEVRIKVRESVELSYRMRDQLLRGKLLEFGLSMHVAWQAKRHYSGKITNTRLDEIYAIALNGGALGGKLLGAGGGGFFLFYVSPFLRCKLMSVLECAGLRIQPFRFERDGLKSWKVREKANYIENVTYEI